ncbi:glycosyltransferase [Patescibacteria group bacterium]|nr:glycosyltransferase [Patescibacteria group bacterium]
MKIDICLPVYNEELIFNNNASQLLEFLRNSNLKYDWQLVFIVNGSSLLFQKMVQEFVNINKSDSSIFLVEEPGKGRAIKTYFNYSQADVLVYMDIDLAVDLSGFNSLLAPILNGEADLCFGSRMLAASMVKRSYMRGLSSQAYIYLSRFFLKHNFSDLQCGFKAITAKAWRQIGHKIQNNDFFFDTELIYLAQKQKLGIQEIPIDWAENRYSIRRSKINIWRDSWSFLWEMFKLRGRK